MAAQNGFGGGSGGGGKPIRAKGVINDFSDGATQFHGAALGVCQVVTVL
jgi:hypothetical protein